MQQEFDIVIVGGGLVGASLAVALAQSPYRVALVEAVPLAPASVAAGQSTYDERPTALTLGSQLSFLRMGVWARMADHAEAIRHVHVSEAGYWGATHLNAHDCGREALGYVVENRLIGAALIERVQTLPNLTLLMPARFVSLVQDADHATLVIEQEGQSATLRTRLVIGADGANSRVRAALGIAHDSTDYAQTAIIANVTPERDPQGVAYERFTPQGPIALLPMQGGRCKLVWTHPTALVESRLRQDDARFLGDLQQAFGDRLGRFRKVGSRIAHPLIRVLSREAVRGRCLLLGNAAHNLHPVAAQGFNLSLRDVTVLNELLAEAAVHQGDPGDPSLLARYVALRAADQARVIRFSHGLVRLFELRLPGLAFARSLGMWLLNLITPLRRAFTLRQMGLLPGQ